MQTLETRYIDKTQMPKGPWTHEPDKKQWMDKSTGLPCLIVRHFLGGLRGYVGVSEGHPWFKQHYDNIRDIEGYSPEVHGGLTYAGPSQGNIRHIVEPGEDKNIWWIGFDCCHFLDYLPALVSYCSAPMNPNFYRDFRYVTDEIESLARQAKELEGGSL